MTESVKTLWALETNPVNRKLVEAFSAKCGHSALSYESVEQLATALKSGNPDVLWIGLSGSNDPGLEDILVQNKGEIHVVVCASDSNVLDQWLASGLANESMLQPVRLEAFTNAIQVNEAEHHSVSGLAEKVDWQLLDEISGGWESDFILIAEEFLRDISTMYHELVELNRTSAGEETCRAAHSLKGSSANFGMTRLSAKMAEAEMDLKEGRHVPQELLDESLEIMNSAVEQIRGHIDSI